MERDLDIPDGKEENDESRISFEREMTTIKELVAENKGVRNYDVDIICIGF